MTLHSSVPLIFDVLEAQCMTDPGLTGERQHFSSDYDANTYLLMREKSVELVRLESGLVLGTLQS